jgi:hypothetical protein
MRLIEFASAEEQIELWKLVSASVWSSLQQQQQQQRQAQATAAAGRAKREAPSHKGKRKRATGQGQTGNCLACPYPHPKQHHSLQHSKHRLLLGKTKPTRQCAAAVCCSKASSCQNLLSRNQHCCCLTADCPRWQSACSHSPPLPY